MKYKALAVMASIMFLAFNSDEGAGKSMYYSSLKFLKSADGPRQVSMIESGHRKGQSTMDSFGPCLPTKTGARVQSR